MIIFSLNAVVLKEKCQEPALKDSEVAASSTTILVAGPSVTTGPTFGG